ncbi:putative FERM domain-containing protein FRMD8P1 isoform X3 [Ciona intestinalis]
MNVVIYLSDNTGHQFEIPNGRLTPTSQYLQLIIATLKLPDALAKKCFSIWLKSPLLGVQLKPQHIPFRMVKQWPMLVEKFSMGTEIEKSQDEPALLFRRNAFLTKEEEMLITDEDVLNILMMEAKYNIQQGIYPCDFEDVEQLGTLLCLKLEDKEKEIQGIVKENLQTLVPPHMARIKRSFLSRQNSIEEKVLKSVKKGPKSDPINTTIEFMKICWQLPYYGSVIFDGLVERAQNNPLTSLFTTQTSLPVKVAINTSGVWVIDQEKKHVLIGLLYDEFNWEMAPPQEEESDAGTSIASLFLEFDDPKTKENEMLRIMSKEAPMMNSMIETCIIMIREKEQIEQAQNAAGPSEESNGVNSKSHAAATSVQTSSTLVRPLFARQNTVTKNRPEKLSFTRLSDSDKQLLFDKAATLTSDDSVNLDEKSFFLRLCAGSQSHSPSDR